MSRFSFVALAVIVSVVGFESAFALYSKGDAVVELTQSNFDSLVVNQQEKIWVVEFYAPWCGHCKQLAPEYKKAAQKIKGVVQIGAVDCDNKANQPLAGRFGIRGFPTIKVFIPGNKEPIDYQGERTADAIIRYATGMIPSKVQNVRSEADLAKYTEDKPAAVLFTSKTETSPLYKSLSLEYNSRMAFVEVRKYATALVEAYNINTFPTLLVLVPGQEQVVYEGELKYEELSKFLDKYALPSTKKSGSKTEEKKHTFSLTKKDFESTVTKDASQWFIVFYSEKCEACRSDEWKSAAKSLNWLAKFGEVDVSKNQELADLLKVTKFPTIKFLPRGTGASKISKAVDYTGELKTTELSNFAGDRLPSVGIEILSQGNMDGVMMHPQPKFILFTDKPKTPALLKALSLAFEDEILFLEAKSSDRHLAARFEVKKFPTLVLVPGFKEEEKDKGVRLMQYQGAVNFHDIYTFLRSVVPSKKEPASKPAAPAAEPETSTAAPKKLVHIQSKNDFERTCYHGNGYCLVGVIYGLEGNEEDDASFLKTMQDMTVKHAGTNLNFGYVNSLQSSFIRAFCSHDSYPCIFAVQPRLKKYVQYIGAYDVKNLNDFATQLAGGRARAIPYETLPTFADETAEKTNGGRKDEL